MSLQVAFDNSYARLPPSLYARVEPAHVVQPRLIRLNKPLAETLGLDPEELESPAGVQFLSGNDVPAGAASIALAYAGHQFGHFVPRLGDGRAVLLGEVVGPQGARRDIQLKGSGRTPFSRGGDGLAALGPVLREFIISEAMAALGVPTTRALAAISTGATVLRETALPGAILTRVAASHIRVGTFQYAAGLGPEVVRALADHVIARHYKYISEEPQPYRALLQAVTERQAELVARWLLIGFIHGVMNTDNCAVSGETIDYGPCAFMDAYDPGTVFSSIDHAGRYAYGNQPRIAYWNLARLAETMLPLLAEEAATDDDGALEVARNTLERFGPVFEAAYLGGLQSKIGLATQRDGDAALARDLLMRMSLNGADFTLTFRRLCDAASGVEGDASVRALFTDPEAYDVWADGWRARLGEEGRTPEAIGEAMRAVNPAIIPRNHQVEFALAAATLRNDFAPFEALLAALAHPFEERPDDSRYMTPPRPEEIVQQTYCGT